jgi:hypothetical protein
MRRVRESSLSGLNSLPFLSEYSSNQKTSCGYNRYSYNFFHLYLEPEEPRVGDRNGCQASFSAPPLLITDA